MAKTGNTHARIDLFGQRFGKLVVVSLAPKRDGDSHQFWNCNCDCGKAKVASSNLLRTGKTRSCGCLAIEVRKATKKVIHGHSKSGKISPTYVVWTEMHRRCSDSSRSNFHLYGGRGISVCARWQQFENFLADMGVRPSGLTLERVNTDGNYEPGNCCWASYKDQQNNRRNNKKITAFGRTLTYAQWADELGASRGIVSDRLKRGWTPERAVSTPVDH